MSLRVLTARDLRNALPMIDAIDAMREAFAALASGNADLPHRTHLQPQGMNTVSLTMPGAITDPPRIGAKLLTLNSENPSRGLPVIQGLVVMFDHDTGAPVGLIEGMSLTATRTGAVSGLATDLLALPGAKTVAIVGAGAQAPAQLEAVCAVRDIAVAKIWSRSLERAEKMADAVRGQVGYPDEVLAVADLDQAVDGVDIISTATPATSPLITGAHLRPGMHVNAVGAFTPEMMEFDGDVVQAAKIVVDDKEATMVESGELISAVEAGLVALDSFVELGDLVMGRAVVRENETDVTLFKSVGLAVQDLSAGGRALESAKRMGIGTELDLSGAA
jgi:ornithine cyclodeaminase/alanine dehydrogenase-like protein (mu-crystallin family)